MIKQEAGQTIVELLVAVVIVAMLLPALLTGLAAARGGRAQQEQRLQAVALLKQSQEAIRSIAERGWDNIEVGTFYPTISSGKWVLSAGTQTLNGFTIAASISEAYRDGTGKLVSSGGTIDPSTKKVITTISWNNPLVSSVDSTFYLTRYHNSATVQTTEADFEQGVKQGTIITSLSGGEVTLGAGGGVDWCSPNLSIAAADLPKSGVANGITAIEGRVFAGTGDNASGVSFANVTISNANPPVSTVAGTFDGYKTNGVFGETNYAYLATDTNSKEIEIVDLTNVVNGKYVEAGHFNSPGNGNGKSIFVSGNIGYMTDNNNHLYTFDLSSKSGSRPSLGSVDLAGVGTKIFVVGSYAYVAISGSTQLQIINVSDGGRTLSVVGQAVVDGLAGQDIFVNSTGSRAYLVTAPSATQKEFFVIDISTKSGDRPTLGSYEASGMSPKGVTVVTGNKAIIVGSGAEEYQVINISNEASPQRCGGLNIDSGINGVASVLEQDGDAYSYLITGDAAAELKIIEGGPGGQFSMTGTFTSAQFDAQSVVAYNRIAPNFIQPQQTSLTFQVAVAQVVNGSCDNAAYYFVGPDATVNTYYSSTGAIPLLSNGIFTNPGQCFKYKAYFSTNDPAFAPVLNDFTVNYSP